MKIQDFQGMADSFLTWAWTAFVAVCYWVVRRVLTDTKRLSLLEQRQDLQHLEIVSAIEETRKQVQEIEKSNDITSATQSRIAEVLDRLDRRADQ